MSAERQVLSTGTGSIGASVGPVKQQHGDRHYHYESQELQSLDRLHKKVDDLTDRVIIEDQRIDTMWTELHALRTTTFKLYGDVASDTRLNIQYARMALIAAVSIATLLAAVALAVVATLARAIG